MRNFLAGAALAVLVCVGWMVPARQAVAGSFGVTSQCGSAAHCSKAQAYADCQRQDTEMVSAMVASGNIYGPFDKQCNNGTGDTSGVWTPYVQAYNGYGIGDTASYDHQCDTGQTYDATAHTCTTPFDSQTCLNHNAEPGFIGVGDTVRSFECANVGGCEFKAVGAHVGYKSGGQQMWSGHYEFTGNPGSACTTNKPTTDPSMADAQQQKTQDCIPAGSGQTMCIKSNGDHCASASAGRQICWHPNEVGTKTDGSVTQTRNGGNTPAPPPPPPPGDTLTQTSTSTGTTTTVTNNNTTTTSTTTITNYSTGSGANGTPGSATGGENSDGSGGDNGACGDSDPTCAGGAGAQGDAYSLGSGKAPGSIVEVFAKFKTDVQATPIASAASGFLTVSASGSCPVWTVPASDWNETMTFDYLCSGAMDSLIAFAGYVVLVGAAYAAFKIAIY